MYNANKLRLTPTRRGSVKDNVLGALVSARPGRSQATDRTREPISPYCLAVQLHRLEAVQS